MLKKAQEAILKAELSKKEKEKVVEEVKLSKRNLRQETETALMRQDTGDIGIPLEPGEPLDEGQILVVLERGALLGSKGMVTKKNKGRGRVQLRVAGAEVKIERHLLGFPKGMMGLSSRAKVMLGAGLGAGVGTGLGVSGTVTVTGHPTRGRCRPRTDA